MPFAPHEIENKRFVTTLRGYHQGEVESFLRAVAADYRQALERVQQPTTEESLAEKAERVLEEAREQGEREAEEIRTAAKREAMQIREAAEREADACFAEIARQAQELKRVEAAVWSQLHSLERAVVDAREAMSGGADPLAARVGRNGFADPMRRDPEWARRA